jgi:hypothetical protein
VGLTRIAQSHVALATGHWWHWGNVMGIVTIDALFFIQGGVDVFTGCLTCMAFDARLIIQVCQ